MKPPPSMEALSQRIEKLEAQLAKRKKIENGLKQRLEDYRLIVENINDVPYKLDVEGRFTYISQVIEYKTGFKPDEMFGRKFHDFVHPDDLPWLRKKFRMRVSTKDFPPQPVDFRALKKSGDYMWLRSSARRLRQNGKVMGVIGVWHDISGRKIAEDELKQFHRKLKRKVSDSTKVLSDINAQLEREIKTRKDAEKAVRESEAHLRSLMEAATNFAVYRLVYDETKPMAFRIVFVSPSIEGLIGVSKADNFEKWNETIHPKDVERVKEANLAAFKTGIFNETFRIFHGPKKQWRWVHVVSTGVDDADHRTKYVNGIFIDVTEQKRAEEALTNREKELSAKTTSLEEMNTALHVLLEKRDQDRSEIEDKIIYNLRELVFPYIQKFKNASLNEKQASYLNVIQTNLENILSPLSRSLSTEFVNLTPTEIQVANFIRQGRSTKEIAQILNVSNRTVESHRKGIRKKLNLSNRKANLRSHLISLSEDTHTGH